jgi:hypothetical protein
MALANAPALVCPGIRAGVVTQKWLALAANLRHSYRVKGIVLEPEKLRPEIVQRIEAMDGESLLLLHRLLLRMEKERLWRELSAETEADRRAGKFDRLTDIIREARTELRRG